MTQELTEAHRLAQLRLGAELVPRVLALWGLLDVDDLDGTMPAWLSAVADVVGQSYRSSELVAAAYLDRHRASALGAGALPAPEPPAAVLPGRALSTSLLVSGPYRLRRKLAQGGVGVDRAIDMARAESAGEAMRHALAGGRNRIIATARIDDAVVGVQRVTAASPCHFCAMLAGRGAVYKTEETADFKPHSRCGCQPELVYDRDAPAAPTAARYADQWAEARRMASTEGIRPEVAFRRIHEDRR